MISSFTPSRLAYSLASSQAGPENGSPLPVVFSGSQGNSPIAAAFKTPRALILSMVGLWPGAGTSLAAQAEEAASSAATPAQASPRTTREIAIVYLPQFDCCKPCTRPAVVAADGDRFPRKTIGRAQCPRCNCVAEARLYTFSQ